MYSVAFQENKVARVGTSRPCFITLKGCYEGCYEGGYEGGYEGWHLALNHHHTSPIYGKADM